MVDNALMKALKALFMSDRGFHSDCLFVYNSGFCSNIIHSSSIETLGRIVKKVIFFLL